MRGKTRRWGSSSSRSRGARAGASALGECAPFFFYPLMARYDEQAHTFRLLTEDCFLLEQARVTCLVLYERPLPAPEGPSVGWAVMTLLLSHQRYLKTVTHRFHVAIVTHRFHVATVTHRFHVAASQDPRGASTWRRRLPMRKADGARAVPVLVDVTHTRRAGGPPRRDARHVHRRPDDLRAR